MLTILYVSGKNNRDLFNYAGSQIATNDTNRIVGERLVKESICRVVCAETRVRGGEGRLKCRHYHACCTSA
ncbi:hypothetical protein PS938_03508 [Pseudomonas fluorescens]|uniref:Uncharacterized protein n=1 Tax=Pseudomonas fluorescens TaxID=294 RepID=A0A5E7UIH2_PSEFL|nr:hypothetical protein PS938_03508 [Pseudomonas fluorescens]